MTLCRMFNHAFAGHRTWTSRCRCHRWQANLPVIDVEEIRTVPYVPLSHPFVDRLIGTIRREFLDRGLYQLPVAALIFPPWGVQFGGELLQR